MLFYNEHDDICLKQGGSFKLLYERDIFERNVQWYTYSHGYFYEGTAYGDGDYETNWEKRIHPRHMNIVEMEEAFPPPSYQSNLDYLFEYQVGVSDSLTLYEYHVMSSLDLKIKEALQKAEDYVNICVKNYEFEQIQEEGLRKLLGLLKNRFDYDLTIEENTSLHDRAIISVYWHYEED